MTKKTLFALALLLPLGLGSYERAAAQDERIPEETQVDNGSAMNQAFQADIVRADGKVITPESSVVHPEKIRVCERTRTMSFLFRPDGNCLRRYPTIPSPKLRPPAWVASTR